MLLLSASPKNNSSMLLLLALGQRSSHMQTECTGVVYTSSRLVQGPLPITNTADHCGPHTGLATSKKRINPSPHIYTH